jgi:glutamate/aspartate transport system substrate-binding protein
MKMYAMLSGAVIALSTTVLAGAAETELGPTLQKIHDSKVIAIGHRTSSIPFSYFDDKENVIGYSQDLCQKIIDAVKLKVGIPDLATRMIPVTSQNRMSLVQNGTVDLECGVTSNLKDRWQQVAFLNSFFTSTPKILTRKDSGIKDFPDLAGKTVVTNAGTNPERMLRTMNDAKSMKMNIQSVKDYGEGLLILQSGRAVAYVMDDILMAGTRLQAQNPSDWVLVGSTISDPEPWGFMVRRDDPQFKALADDALSALMRSTEIKQIYTRWFLSPVPPKAANFDFPMSDEVAKLYAAPNDRPAAP